MAESTLPETSAPALPPPVPCSYTESFAGILGELGASLMVTTYQAGMLVMIRNEGGLLNTHFRGFGKPMGLAVQGDRLAVGTVLEIWEFHNLPAVARRLPPPGSRDGCFLPRGSCTTGDIQIHEMGWAGDELWFVNTRFSCLCTRSGTFSFVPRWRPPFITALGPEDRCHLNGLCLSEGRPAFVTALGATNEPRGWRSDKKAGGILMEAAGGNILLRGLSMPHSPRIYDGRLWVLESGNGSVGVVDPVRMRYELVARLPGFTRGLDFCGPYAFVGLSQVRESAIFSGIAIAERPLAERCCGVGILDTRTGRLAASLKFEDPVQEIFAVQVLPGFRAVELINDNPALIADSFVLPDDALGSVVAPLVFPAKGGRTTAAPPQN
jgi:uncharacterized protein (TIGR03032 family)